MRPYRWITRAIVAGIILIAGVWFTVQFKANRSLVPPPSVVDINSFLQWRPEIVQLKIVQGTNSEHLIAVGPMGGFLPSGPSAYVFDESGKLVDWSDDIGDDAVFDKQWKAQSSMSQGEALPKSEVSAWLANHKD